MSVTLACDLLTSAIGASDASSTATGGGGSITGYSYNWTIVSGNTAANTASNLPAGTVSVTLTDAYGCTATDACIIEDPACSVTGSASANPTVCVGSSDGSVTAIMNTGGLAPYAFNWDANALAAATQSTSSGTATGLPAGAYVVTITDANACSVTATATVGTPAPLLVSVTPSNPPCAGTTGPNTGSALAASVSGSAGGESFLWDATAGGQTSANATNLAGTLAGTVYSVSVTDANNCVGTSSVTITAPIELTSSVISTNDASCPGVCDGSAEVNGAGGNIATSGDYSYAWDDAANQATANATGLCGGNPASIVYTVTVSDDAGCTVTDQVQIIEPSVITATSSSSTSTCGQSDGTATVDAVGNGTAPYTYSWQTLPFTPVQNTQTASNLPAGSYDVIITDNNGAGCSITITETISDAAGPSIDAFVYNRIWFVSRIMVGKFLLLFLVGRCLTLMLGRMVLVIPVGNTTDPSISGLSAGNYNLVVSDATGCAVTGAYSVTEPAELTASINAANDPLCFGEANGNASVSGAGGTGAIGFTWSTSPTQNTATATGLSANVNYLVTLSDAVGCTVTDNVSLTEPNLLSILNLVPSPVSCFGLTDGGIDASIDGGTLPYTFSWTDGSNSGVANLEDLNGFGADNYSISVSDANGCSVTGSQTITEPAALGVTTVSVNNVSCTGDNSGNAEVLASGGAAPLAYLWLPSNQAGPVATNLTAGNYTVSVSDANNCDITLVVTITQPTLLSVSLNPSNPSCALANDGQINSNANGGTLPYTYQWSNFAASPNVSGLAGGVNPTNVNYSLVVTDAFGCTATDNADLTDPVALSLTSSSATSTCGNSDGAVTVFVVQGNPGTTGYSYSWSDNATGSSVGNTDNASNLYAGNYTATVTDGVGCTATIGQGVTDAGAPSVNVVTTTDVSCFGLSDGAGLVAVAGGTQPYSYLWDDPLAQTVASPNGLPLGTWAVVVEDANGCIATTNIVINEPTLLSAGITAASDVTCFNGTDGSATVNGNGGTLPYAFQWNDGNAQTTATATGLSPINYTAAVTDANGCFVNVTVSIGHPAQMTLSTSPTDAYCFTPSGQVCVSATNGTTPLSYLWDAAAGNQTAACAVSVTPGFTR